MIVKQHILSDTFWGMPYLVLLAKALAYISDTISPGSIFGFEVRTSMRALVPSSAINGYLVMRCLRTDFQFETTIMFPSLVALRNTKLDPSPVTS